MVIAQLLRPNDAVQIGLHELLDEVDFLKVVEGCGSEDVKDGNDVLVVEMAEELDFAERPEAEHGVIERRNLLDRNFLT